ncbi:UDP-glucose dehydrogenase family protein [Tepidibacter formicigenes]|jgi:UDPglucose 6-dehydrogenase|uniref:UDP-glucose 6-dehydrogenase n=1 Tax=Tepidibacter formicigenes DSM 15518 TaxID=1123349 RepID=A0A1M6QVE3_9FIRM|nr:UDP-glucose/GDP-mannose dehydrogenase family protein [Tepidibacter formicigenes]SHK24232.1 UDP-glucose dehydrogenase [Tepidibacter formicigenes DSM 15518]
MKKIAVIGSGYVGLVAGTCLADFGLNVMCVDNNKDKIEGLKKGIIPIYEPGLDDLVKRNMYYKRLDFTTDIKSAVEESEVIFIAVGTPPKDDGSADLQYVLQVAKDIAMYMNGYKVIVDKSTVPIGTGQKVKKVVNDILKEREVDYKFDVVSNPEFLREGSAIYDFTHPDRVVIGSESEKATKIMRDVYRVLYLNETPFVETNIETAEMIKYASNAFLAMKITFINEVANLCEKVGANVQHVAKAMGRDGRISPKFLHAGPGYGGSCFPKDTKALANIAREHGEVISLIETTVKANENQKLKMVEKIKNAMGSLEGKTLGILGITFKPKTDDMREAPSLVILTELAKMGAKMKIFDPEGEKEGKWRLGHIKDSIEFYTDEYEANINADALIIITEWHQFRNMDLDRLKESMKDNYFFDLRNIYERELVEEKGFKYFGVGV